MSQILEGARTMRLEYPHSVDPFLNNRRQIYLQIDHMCLVIIHTVWILLVSVNYYANGM